MNQRSPHQVVLARIARGPAFLARGLIQLYRHTLSALIGLECRHLPTCSSYADEAIGRFGLWAGGWMTLARLCRCHPLGTSGLDFVLASFPDHSRWYLPGVTGAGAGPMMPSAPRRLRGSERLDRSPKRRRGNRCAVYGHRISRDLACILKHAAVPPGPAPPPFKNVRPRLPAFVGSE